MRKIPTGVQPSTSQDKKENRSNAFMRTFFKLFFLVREKLLAINLLRQVLLEQFLEHKFFQVVLSFRKENFHCNQFFMRMFGPRQHLRIYPSNISMLLNMSQRSRKKVKQQVQGDLLLQIFSHNYNRKREPLGIPSE